ncbi:MAG: mechanosensitive ion channel [Thermomicrobiales bacterium]|nr:mechanosensitive ion channel [Thermomicrobiales bacterium]
MTDVILDRLDNARDQLIDLGVAVAQLLIVFLLAALIARWLRRRVQRRVRSAESPVMAVFAENTAVVGIYVIAITIVLAFWGMTWTGLLTALSIGTVAVAFGLQDLLRSLVGGVLVLIEQPFSLGDRVKIRDIEGRVEQIELRTTVIRADNGDRIAVPNALVFSDPVINRSPNRVSRVMTVSGIEGVPAELKRRAQEALVGVAGIDGVPIVSVRTRQGRQRMRQAWDALPSIGDEGKRASGESTGFGLRIVWSGDRGSGLDTELKRRLQQAFPEGRVSSGG